LWSVPIDFFRVPVAPPAASSPQQAASPVSLPLPYPLPVLPAAHAAPLAPPIMALDVKFKPLVGVDAAYEPASPDSSGSLEEKDGVNGKKTDSAPFGCPVPGCGLRYRRKGDLKVHTYVKHRDQPELPALISKPKSNKVGKKWCCPLPDCPSGYTRKSDLLKHISSKHGVEGKL